MPRSHLFKEECIEVLEGVILKEVVLQDVGASDCS